MQNHYIMMHSDKKQDIYYYVNFILVSYQIQILHLYIFIWAFKIEERKINVYFKNYLYFTFFIFLVEMFSTN